MTKCTIEYGGLPVMDWSKGKPRVFETKEDAQSWAKLSCYPRYTIKPLKPQKQEKG